MGTIKQGILGGFSGKVGTVVGSTWKTVHYMRALAVSVSDPRTEKQVRQRTKFSMAVNFLRTFTPFVRIGYNMYAQNQSGFNAALSYVMKNALTTNGAVITINYNKVMVSRGSLMPAFNPVATIAENKASFSWDDNSGMGDAQETDLVMLLAYNKDKGEAVYNPAAAMRSALKAELAIPVSWKNDALAVYLGFCSADGKNVSNSVCVVDSSSDNNSGGGSSDGGGIEDNPLG